MIGERELEDEKDKTKKKVREREIETVRDNHESWKEKGGSKYNVLTFFT